MKKLVVLLMLGFGVSAGSRPVHSNGKTGSSMAENAESDCGTVVMLRPAEVREGFSRDLDCSQGNGKNTASGQACFQYTVLLDHGGSFMIAQPEVPSITAGKRVCIVPGASGSADVMRAE